jgi:Membrane domain of glycerophosphoryl diester phosphodiesterase
MNPMPRLRPMSISDMLDAAFRLYRQHFLTFIGIVALLQVPMAMLQYLAQLPYQQALQRFTTRPPVFVPGRNPFDLFPFAQLLPYYALIVGLSILQYLLVYNLMTGALANAISRSYLGQPISILSSYTIGFKRVLALIVASLTPLAISLVFVAAVAGCAIGAFSMLGVRSGEQSNVGLAIAAIFGLFGLTMLVLIPIGLFFYVRLLLATQAIILEGQGPFAGLARSWRLVGQAFWRSLGIVLLVYVFMYIISLVVQLPLLVLGVFFGMIFSNTMLYQGIALLVTYGVMILVLPFQFIIFTLLYYDLRVRKEGYDLELLAQAQQAAAS